MKAQLFVGLALFASQLCRAEAAAPIPEKLHSKFTVSVPYGPSYVDYLLAQPTTLNPLRVLYTVSPSCPQIPNTGVSVQYEGSTVWQKTTYENGGYFKHTDQKIVRIRFALSQYAYTSERCELNLFTQVKMQPPQEEVYAGLLGYAGGFSKDQEINLVHSFKGSKIRFDVPEYCKGIEIKDVRLKVGGGLDEVMKKTNLTTFELSQAKDFDRIYMTLNGPKESCDIPVYIYQDAE